MKKSSLVMILALVGMVGCGYGKQAKLPVLRHPVDGSPCSNQAWASTAGESYNCVNGKWINNNPGFIMGADGGESVIHEGIHQKCPDKGCNDPEFYKDAYPNNPIAQGPESVLSYGPPPCKKGDTKRRLKGFDGKYFYTCKPKPKKRYAMGDGDNYREFEVHEQPDLPTPDKAAVPVAMTGDPYHPGSGWNFEMKGSHVVWLKNGGYLCEANDGSQNNSCREVEQGEIDWHAAHPEDYTRSFYKSVEKAKSGDPK